jgi:hypothetical protein
MWQSLKVQSFEKVVTKFEVWNNFRLIYEIAIFIISKIQNSCPSTIKVWVVMQNFRFVKDLLLGIPTSLGFGLKQIFADDPVSQKN